MFKFTLKNRLRRSSLYSLLSIAAIAQLCADENLLKNPGFEDLSDKSSWNENNWAKMEAVFERDGTAVSVLWSGMPMALTQYPDLDLREWDAFDMMGNPIEAIETIELTLAPIYLLNKSQP